MSASHRRISLEGGVSRWMGRRSGAEVTYSSFRSCINRTLNATCATHKLVTKKPYTETAARPAINILPL